MGVFTHDAQGTHRDEYFYTTDPDLPPAQIITWFTARWPIETTFQEVRAHLGSETPRWEKIHFETRCSLFPCWNRT